MSTLEAAVARAAAVPGAYGAVLCDFEGESVVLERGPTPLPPAVTREAIEHVPEALRAAHPAQEFLLRLAGAEPCPLLAHFGRHATEAGAGALESLELGYQAVGLLVRRLPEDYYLVIVLDRRRARGFARARRVVAQLEPVLAREVA